mgnify:CR=1 FL=1
MLETIYNDFTTKLLPKISEGLTITKDYFMDLFGRYAKFLFIQDLSFAILSLIVLIITLIVLYKLIKKCIEDDGWNGNEVLLIFFALPIILSVLGFITNGINAIKDVYVPEIRVYEEISSYINNK